MRWLLVSGAGRSGTTFLNVLLNSHPKIAIFTEAGIDILIDNARRCLAWGNIYDDSRGYPLARIPHRKDEDKLLQKLFELRFKKTRLKIIGDKMPNVDDEILPRYRSAVGEFLKLYIVRAPTAVIASSMQRRANALIGADDWHVASAADAIVEWALNWEHVARSNHDPSALVVSYEQFERDPDVEIARIAAFLRVDGSGFAPRTFSRTSPSPGFDRDDAHLIEDVLGPVETLMRENLHDALAAIPLIYPKVGLAKTIQINTRQPCAALFLKKGFNQLEDWGVWTDQHDALFGFRVAPGTQAVTVSLHFTAFMGREPRFDLHVRSDDQDPFTVFKFDDSVNRLTLDFPCQPEDDGTVQLQLHMPELKGEADEPTDDPRRLGIGLFSFRVKAA